MLRWIGIVLGGLVGLLVVVALGARACDGPLAMFPGGPLTGGELAAFPEDWSFAADVREIELQLEDPPRSRTVWLVVHEGDLVVPCGFLNVPFFKQWPHQAARDGRAVVRVEGTRYRGTLTRITDPAVLVAVARASAAKYGFGEPSDEPPDPDEVWFFRFSGR